MTTTVLVTGSLGYIGSRLTASLMEHGFRCVGYDAGFFKGCTLFPPVECPTRLIDARDLQERDLDGVDAVVHLAGISNDPFGSLKPEAIYDPTRVYALQIARMCKQRGIRFIFASSCSVYGVGDEALVTEDAPTYPQTPYSLNKLQVEQGLRALSDARFCPIMLRFATVFGLSPRMRFDLVINMLAGMAVTTGRILLNSNGKAWRPHVHLEDVCQAIRGCLERPPRADGGVVLNVGETTHNLRILDVAELVKRCVPGCQIEFLKSREEDSALRELIHDRKIQDGVDTRTYQVSFERIKRVLPTFRCQPSVEARIEEMVVQLRALLLTKEQFKDIAFYRLQRLEVLFREGRLTEDVRWNSRVPLESVAETAS